MSAELQMNSSSSSVAQNTPVENRGQSSNPGTETGTPRQVSIATSAADHLDIAVHYLNKALMDLVLDRDLFPTKDLGGYLRILNGTKKKAQTLRNLAAKLKFGPCLLSVGRAAQIPPGSSAHSTQSQGDKQA
jgi:hypothetical protein